MPRSPAEDRRFYDHGGIDLQSVVRAAAANVEHKKITSGASTIDMQLVRNILVQQALQIKDPKASKAAYLAAIDDTATRKLAEMKLAIGLDKKYTKQEILLGYLNITGFGGDTYGVEAAAREVLQRACQGCHPGTGREPHRHRGEPERAQPRQPQVLSGQQGAPRPDPRATCSSSSTSAPSNTPRPWPPRSRPSFRPRTTDASTRSTRNSPATTSASSSPPWPPWAPHAAEREENWARGGYKLYTSIDLNQQDVAQAALSASAPADETRFALGASAVSVQPGTGRILVMAQNKGFDNSKAGGGPTTTAVNFSTDRAYGGSSGFPTGSTYKIFTLTDWLQKGHGLYDSVNGTQRPFPMSSFAASCEAPFVGPPYKPPNDSPREGGQMSVLQATQASVNVAFISMAQKLDLCDIRADAVAMGVHRADGKPLDAYPSSTLGTNEIAPLTMAEAIATIGANGTYCAPTIIDKIIDPTGKELPGQPQQCSQAIAPNIASTLAFALAAVMRSGTGSPGNPRDGTPIVGKTGTTDGAQQNWLIATTTKVALAVWVGNIDGGKQSLRRITVAGTNGYNTKFNIFRTIMRSFDADPNYAGGAFPAPDPQFLRRPAPPPPAPTPTPAPAPQFVGPPGAQQGPQGNPGPPARKGPPRH